MKRWAVRLLLPFVFFLLFLLFVHFAKQAGPNRDDAKLMELQQLASVTPVFPGFVEVGSDDSSSSDDAGVYKRYRSRAGYEEVRNFYVTELGQRGWSLAKDEKLYYWSMDYGGRTLVFSKGGLSAVIQHEGERKHTWNYSVSFVWRVE